MLCKTVTFARNVEINKKEPIIESNKMSNRENESNTQCPICKKDDRVHGVSYLHRSGINCVSKSGSLVGGELSSGSGASISALSANFAPTDEPSKGWVAFIGYGLILLGGFAQILWVIGLGISYTFGVLFNRQYIYYTVISFLGAYLFLRFVKKI